MLDKSRMDLAEYRLEKAKECLHEAEYMVEPEGYSSILNNHIMLYFMR